MYISCLKPKEELTGSLVTTHSWAPMNAGQALTVTTKNLAKKCGVLKLIVFRLQ